MAEMCIVHFLYPAPENRTALGRALICGGYKVMARQIQCRAEA